jgi:hypothetical protein
MKPLILLDFDGVLFNSAYEAYKVCEHVAAHFSGYRRGITFEEFLEFRAYLTDAWQFARLYSEARHLRDYCTLRTIQPDAEDWQFTTRFFESRAEMMKDSQWAKLMSPYPFFHELSPLLASHPESFRILSTRNVESIRRTLTYFDAPDIEVFGQEHVREYGSKIEVARGQNWLSGGRFVIYLDDMTAHLEPFQNKVDLCIHAEWGYDAPRPDSYSQGQALQVLSGFMRVAHG